MGKLFSSEGGEGVQWREGRNLRNEREVGVSRGASMRVSTPATGINSEHSTVLTVSKDPSSLQPPTLNPPTSNLQQSASLLSIKTLNQTIL